MGPGGHAALSIDRPCDSTAVPGTVGTILDVFFPAPYQLDRSPSGLGDLHRFFNMFDQRTASEATSHVGCVDLDLFRLQSSDFRCLLKRSGLTLSGNPDVTSIRADMSGTVHGLHGGVGQIGQDVLGSYLLVGLAQSAFDITIISGRDTRPVKTVGELFLYGLGTEMGLNSLIPLDVEGISPFPGGVDGIRAHRNPSVYFHHVADSRHLPGGFFIIGNHLGPISGGPGNGCVKHIGHKHVDTKLGLPVDLGGNVQTRYGCAHNFKFTLFLQPGVCGDGETGGFFAQLSIGEAAVAGLVVNLAQ